MEKETKDLPRFQDDYANLERNLAKEWDSLGIDNDFIFYYVMQDETLLMELVQMILPDVPISRLEIQAQKTVDVGLDIHGVRFDIFAKDQDERAFTVEMQVVNRHDLPKRIRYYKSMADTQMLEKGVSYDELSESYVIMICPFDMFDMGLHLYTFTYRCMEDTSIELKDGTKSIILNAAGTANDVSGSLKAFLDYVAGKMSEDSYVRRVDMAVELAKMDAALRRDYIVRRQNQIVEEKWAREKGRAEGRTEGREEGLAEGRAEGLAEGRNELAQAIRMLKDGKVQDDLISAGISKETIDMANTLI